MSRSLFACRPDDAPRTAERTMREHQVRRLPVVDDAGRLVGIVSLNDIALESTSKPAEIATTLVAICRHHNTALVATEHEMVTLRPSTA
jgi:CBS domain-containing protein